VNNNTHWSGPFTFVQGADTQFGLIDFFKNNFTGGGVWSEDLAIFKDAITEWNALNPIPKFVTICGDLVNDMPQDPHNNRSKQLNDFKNALTSLRKEIPLVLLGGNHDFLNTPTNASIK
ncbi:PREDICTED: serine/threonine-protein phosphatase CPPED1-like, partial [Rhagoletis zephyria]|uniref:serine/threonine-protein phosphatase CPPED1-like n=1 Tax=Rhagoletis zephyria TaxID=28612 RepID=UPI0008116AFE